MGPLNYGSLFLLVLVSTTPTRCHSWGWFSSSTGKDSTDENFGPNAVSGGRVSEFSMNGIGDEKGMKLVDSARHKLVGQDTCWQNAYQLLFAGCSKILANNEKRSRFAWHLSDCFQKDSGRKPFPNCDAKSAMVRCLEKLNDHEHKVFLEFSLETNSICYQLQSHAFKSQMERLVNNLKSSAEYTEQQLDDIQERTSTLLESSETIHSSLSLIDHQVRDVAQMTTGVNDQIGVLHTHSEAVYKQSRDIAESQAKLQEGQARMNEKVKEGMDMLQNSYANLGQEVEKLKNEAFEIQSQIGEVGEAMSSRMLNLQATADDIENKAGESLGKQQLLLDGQSTALKGLQILTEFQSEALEESRSTLEQLVSYSHKQQEELIQRQEQLHQIHNHLAENFNTMLEAQEAFESKQASMFAALDKLFALHNAMLLESRIIKTFFVYFLLTIAIYMFTSTKQTYTIRARLYIGLCATLVAEVMLLRLVSSSIEQQSWMINITRSLFVVLASIQFLHAVFTYRDYEVLNHRMIQTLVDKVNEMQRSKVLSWESDSEISWSSWVDTDLQEEVNQLEDPDYVLPEEVAENSITPSVTKKYNLRSRSNANSCLSN